MRSRPHDDAMAELYRNDPTFALEVVNGILEDGDQAELLTVLRQMAQAFGGLQAVAEQAHLNPTQLYRTLSPKGKMVLRSNRMNYHDHLNHPQDFFPPSWVVIDSQDAAS